MQERLGPGYSKGPFGMTFGWGTHPVSEEAGVEPTPQERIGPGYRKGPFGSVSGWGTREISEEAGVEPTQREAIQPVGVESSAEGDGEIPSTPPEALVAEEDVQVAPTSPEAPVEEGELERPSRFRRALRRGGSAIRRGRNATSIALGTLAIAALTSGVVSWHVWGQEREDETPTPIELGTPTPSGAAGTPRPPEPTPEPTVKKPTETQIAPSPTLVYRPPVGIPPERIPIIFRGLRPWESFDAPDGSIVVGDVVVNGITMFDSRPETGLIVDLQRSARVDAPWGADVQMDIKPEDKEKILDQNIQTMKESGCVDGCQTVDVVVFPGGEPQGQ